MHHSGQSGQAGACLLQVTSVRIASYPSASLPIVLTCRLPITHFHKLLCLECWYANRNHEIHGFLAPAF